MKLSPKMENALNEQVVHELHSAYLYWGMRAYFEHLELRGFAGWMQKQAEEESGHAKRIFDYLADRDGSIRLKAVPQPRQNWKSPLEVFQAAHGHEQKVTALIHRLVDIADAVKDKATHVMLEWFVTEQVEEEASTRAIVERLKLAGNDKSALLLLDAELGQRKA